MSYQQSATSCMCPPSFAQYPDDVVKYQLTVSPFAARTCPQRAHHQ
ncbi:hypothetical protein F441_01225 [Phytophthora nicotianae CJ01A1]|uniref:Uncharacterized protein n=1 Tax=Phytophthora nicotianae CJ01A1 TaxID=1317063 RepID=W2XVK5_PHYNI|nr:hypothetical protein F441_01225 [Phytophthora nicotianae CJ01A1]